MLEIVALLSLVGAVALLFLLSAVDLKEGLLPNELVLSFLVLGIAFHCCTLFRFLEITDMALGSLIGFAALYVIRHAAHRFYAQDALGFGDVKLLAAAGLWLGPYHILIAMTLGALLGIAHGLGAAIMQWQKTKSFPPLGTLSLPAGPGFAMGIVMTGIFAFRDFPALLLQGGPP